MSANGINNVNVVSQELLPTPEQVKAALPLTAAAERTVREGRATLRRILAREDPRLFVVVGPCSIHDAGAAREYATRLRRLADEVAGSLFLIMRVYFEKPRTTVGWKGLINDPFMDDSFHIEKGLYLARELLLYIAELGLPAATEALDPITPQYLNDLVTWTAIGARTTESQTHREMASGLSTPVGFKNGTDGSLGVAINALKSVARPHHFLGINQNGQCAVFRTRGNRDAHVVLRGGGGRPNYDSVSIAMCERELAENGLPANIVVDCSHGNSNKDPALQSLVAENCVNQILEGNRSIVGLMLESNLHWGNQPIPKNLAQLKYGVSVTDACIDWSATETLLKSAAAKMRPLLAARAGAA
ncbi:phospho-2-dehydro-3-deoxyheptonate aldolase [Sulfurifustis variabilis]|uniref:Phospho-2-dehydro-3-deoxyheptonate aldolase n=1 Tax=Sulfurifustis variabilis TaxID=1675686 RepID=A0A1B4V2B2_9GAMM|nr:3-deoxy-7-phosphoheptulonate synthase [Sulfurifustis variabilis]BAU47660.1 phospho-2-dehydro-3-deoxyheptonate aldolase [Sulfurifustis variabilis]